MENNNSLYNLIFVHENLIKMTDDNVFEMLKAIFPERRLYSMSTDWRKDKNYILKARGTEGDVIVGWAENQRIGQNPSHHCPIL